MSEPSSRSLEQEAYGYLRRVFEICAPQCEPLPDLMGLCTQIDNLIAGYRNGFDLRAARAEEREKVAAFMLARSIATGHGDTIEDLLSELYHGAIEIGRKSAERTSVHE